MAGRIRLLFYSESHQPGGSDRFLADLLRVIDRDAFEVLLAGNRDPRIADWLRREVPEAPVRHEVPIATMESPRLGAALRRIPGHPGARLAPDPSAPPALEAGGPTPAPLPLRTAAAAMRAQQAVSNHRRLKRLFARLAPDVVHINNGGYPGAESCRVAALAARDAGAGVVHFVHNMPYPPAWPVTLERRLDAMTDAATGAWGTPAHRARAALESVRGLPPEKIHVIPCGVEVPEHPPPRDDRLAESLHLLHGRPVVVMVASFEERKGHLPLLEALARLSSRGIRPVTLFAGGGDRQPLVERRAAALGLAGDVRFLGWRDDVTSILSLGDLFVLPSLGNECLPYSILEAMAQSLPVVSTDVAGIPEAVQDGRTGAVVAPGDVSALAGAMALLLEDSRRARAFGAAGRARVAREFTLTATAERMAALYRAVRPDGGSRARPPAA